MANYYHVPGDKIPLKYQQLTVPSIFYYVYPEMVMSS